MEGAIMGSRKKWSKGWVAFAVIGCFIFLFSAFTPAFATPVTDFEDITADIGRGFGSGMNKYSWASTTFSVDDNIYIGTFNVNFDVLAVPEYIQQIGAADGPLASLAPLDAFRRLWSGSPVTKSTGGEIWQYNTQTHNWGSGPVLKTDSEDVGFRKMIEYDGYIYAGTANGPNGPAPGDPKYSVLPPGASSPPLPAPTVSYTDSGTALWRSQNGTTWEEVSGGPSLNPYNSSNRAMEVINGKLYVGTENAFGPELWSFNGSSWTQEIGSGGFAPGTLAVGEIAEFGGKTYVGTWGGGSGGHAYRLLELNGGPPVDRTPNYPDNGDSGVMQLIHYNGKFLLGTVNYTGGFSLLETTNPSDPTSWNVVTLDGFGTEYPAMGGSSANAYSWSSQEVGGTLYLGTFNTNKPNSWLDQLVGTDVPLDGRGQIWYTEDGTHWKILEDNGFDSIFTYGFRTMTQWDNRLVVGSASNMFLPDIFSTPYGHDLLVDILGDGDGGPIPINLLSLDPQSLFALLREKDIDQTLIARLFSLGEGIGSHLPYIGTQVFMSGPASVPEPASLLLLGMGLIGFAVTRRKKTVKN